MLPKWDLPLSFTRFPAGTIKQVPSNLAKPFFQEAKFLFYRTGPEKNFVESSHLLRRFFFYENSSVVFEEQLVFPVPYHFEGLTVCTLPIPIWRAVELGD